MGYLYLATPYSKFPGGIEAAYELACREQARLISARIAVFCPISHTHGAAIHGAIDPLDHGIWLPADWPFMDGADGLIMLMADSWKQSFGMAEELKAFVAAGKPVHWMMPGEIPASLKKTAATNTLYTEGQLLRKLYGAAYSVESGLRRECDHATYEGGTEAVDDLREILQLLEDHFPSLVYTPFDDDGDE